MPSLSILTQLEALKKQQSDFCSQISIFKCRHCGVALSHPILLKHHLRIRHKDNDDSIESSPEASAFKEFMKRIRVSASIDFRKSSETPSEDHEKDDLVDKSDDPKFKSQQSGNPDFPFLTSLTSLTSDASDANASNLDCENSSNLQQAPFDPYEFPDSPVGSTVSNSDVLGNAQEGMPEKHTVYFPKPQSEKDAAIGSNSEELDNVRENERVEIERVEIKGSSPLHDVEASLESDIETHKAEEMESPDMTEGWNEAEEGWNEAEEGWNEAEDLYQDSAEDPWGTATSPDKIAHEKRKTRKSFENPAPTKRVSRSKRNKQETSKNRKKLANSKKVLRSMAGARCKRSFDEVSVAASNIYDRVKKRHSNTRRSEAEINSTPKKMKSSKKSCAPEGEQPVLHAEIDNPAPERTVAPEDSIMSDQARVSEPSMGEDVQRGSQMSENGLIIEVKKEVKIENYGDDTDDTKSYEDDDEALTGSVGTSLAMSERIGSGSENKFCDRVASSCSGETASVSLKNFSSISSHSRGTTSNVDVKPDMSVLKGSVKEMESADGQGSLATSSDPSDSNMIVTLCYFCLSETIFFEGSLDNFRNHLWDHLLEFDFNDGCPLDCELAYDGNERGMALHFFDVHQHLPIVHCPKCSIKFLYDSELLSHTCSCE